MSKFIVVEGIHGSGKTTLVEHIAEYLQEQDIPVLATFEPGSGIPEVRPRYLDSMGYDKFTQLLLFTADRTEHVTREIFPALDSGKWVVCERYIDSTWVHQCFMQGNYEEDLLRLHEHIKWPPDLTIYLDVSEDVAVQRLTSKLDNSDYIGSNFVVSPSSFTVARKGFQKLGYLEPPRYPYPKRRLFLDTTFLDSHEVWEEIEPFLGI